MKRLMHWIILLTVGGTVGALLGGRFGWKGTVATIVICAVWGASYPQRLLFGEPE